MLEQISDEPINHGSYTFGEDSHQADKNINKVLQEVPVLAEWLERLEKKIVNLQTPETLSDDILLDPQKFMHAMAGRKAALVILREEKNYIQSKINGLPSE